MRAAFASHSAVASQTSPYFAGVASIVRSVPFKLAVATFAVRIRTFSAPPDDGNVGLYFYVAHEWLSGWLPYTRAWEYKPPGLFAVYAGGLAIFRTPMLTAAILSATAIFCTALALRAIGRACDTEHGNAIGTVAACFYIFLSTEDAGLTGDAPILAAAFAAWAVYLYGFSHRVAERPVARAFCVGLLAGLALQMKLTALPIAALLALLIAASAGRRMPQMLAVFFAAAALPVLPEIYAYANAGRIAQLYDANVGATLRRLLTIGGADPRAGRLQDAMAQTRVLAPAAELVLFAAIPPTARRVWVLFAWLACALLAILLSREYYERQFFELIAPLSILGAIGAVRLGRLLAQPRVTAIILVLLAFALHDYYTVRKTLQTAYERSFAHRQLYNREHLEFLLAGLREYAHGDPSLYAFQESPIVYVYLQAQPPTRYPFSADLLEPKLWPMLGFSGAAELQRIVAARPHYVLLGQADGPRDDRSALTYFARSVKMHYRLVATIDGDPLYRLAPSGR